MNLIRQIAFLVGILMIAPLSVYLQTSSPSNGDAYCYKTINFFRAVMATSGQGSGLALTQNDCPENQLFADSRISNIPLAKKLDLIVEKLPAYKWRNINGVVNLYPSKALPGILATKIKEFKVRFDTYNLSIFTDQLLKSPEVIKEQQKLNMRQGLYFGGLQAPPSGQPVEMVFQDKTVQEILNEVVGKRKGVCWLYRESVFGEANTYTLEFIYL